MLQVVGQARRAASPAPPAPGGRGRRARRPPSAAPRGTPGRRRGRRARSATTTAPARAPPRPRCRRARRASRAPRPGRGRPAAGGRRRAGRSPAGARPPATAARPTAGAAAPARRRRAPRPRRRPAAPSRAPGRPRARRARRSAAATTHRPTRSAGSAAGHAVARDVGGQEALGDELLQALPEGVLALRHQRGVRDRQAERTAEQRGDGEPVGDRTDHRGLRARVHVPEEARPRRRSARRPGPPAGAGPSATACIRRSARSRSASSEAGAPGGPVSGAVSGAVMVTACRTPGARLACGHDHATDPDRCPAPAAARRVRRHPTGGGRGRGARRRRRLQLGPLLPALRRARGRALRVLDDARRLGGGDLAGRDRRPGHVQQLPQPRAAGRHGPHRRPHQRRPADPRHRVRLVREGLRRVRLRVRHRRRRGWTRWPRPCRGSSVASAG